MTGDLCNAEYARHPTQPHLVFVCVKPKGYDGEHDNAFPKPKYAILRTPPKWRSR